MLAQIKDTFLCDCVLLYEYSMSVAVVLLITEILLSLYFKWLLHKMEYKSLESSLSN
jgi:hypothetical protein